MNLIAETKTGMPLELYQTKTEDTYYCLGWVNGVDIGLSWKEKRDRYFECITKNTCTVTPYCHTWLHIRYIKHQPFIEFGII